MPKIHNKIISNPLIDELLDMHLMLFGQLVSLNQLGQLDDLIFVLAFLIGADQHVSLDGSFWILIIFIGEHQQFSVDLLT